MATSAESPRAEPDALSLLGEAWMLFSSAPVPYLLAGGIVLLGSAMSVGILSGPLMLGLIRMAESQRRKENIEVGQVLDGLRCFGPAFLTMLLVTLACALGFVLMVLPGVVIALMSVFSLHFVALRDLPPLQAIPASWTLVRKNLSGALLIVLMSLAVNIAGGIVVLGLAFTIPFSVLLMTLSFRTLCQQAED